MKLLKIHIILLNFFQMVKNCPDKCICLSTTKVLCNGAELASIPQDIPTEVEELSFSKNSLTHFDENILSKYRKITKLNLNANDITVFRPFSFRQLFNLNELTIQNNPLKELTQFSFGAIENVTQLDLRNNKIKIIHPYAFSGSRNIAMLLLQGNPILRIRSRAFSGLRTVQFLYLPAWIKILESDSFYNLQGIGLLRLHSLSLQSLRPYTFRGLKNVTQISIQESDLGTIKQFCFHHLYNVGELRIINNKVDVLESFVIEEESNVDGVVLKGNHFLKLKNKISTFSIQSNERTVIIENYFPCDCSLNSILLSKTAKSKDLFARHNFCVAPYALHGKPISVVENMECPAIKKESEIELKTNFAVHHWKGDFLIYWLIAFYILYE